MSGIAGKIIYRQPPGTKTTLAITTLVYTNSQATAAHPNDIVQITQHTTRISVSEQHRRHLGGL